MNAVAIRVEGLVKDYVTGPPWRRKPPVRALAGVDLEVRRGEVFGFIGPNGAGKSTTIRVLLDLLRATGGRVEVLGAAPDVAGPRLRARIGYLPGELHLAGHRTAAEELATWRAFAVVREPNASANSPNASPWISTAPSAGCRRATSRRSA